MKRVHIYSRFEDLPPQYHALFDASCRRAGFFLSLPWFLNLCETGLDNKAQLRIYGLESTAEPRLAYAALPMRCQTAGKRGLRPRTLEAIANFYTSLFAPILADTDAQPAYLQALAAGIAGDTPRWDLVDLHPLARGTAQYDAIVHAFRQAGLAVQSYFCFGNWYLQVGRRSFQEYFDSLPSRLKNTVQRKSRQLQSAGRLRLEIVTGGQELEAAITAYEQIYRLSWKPSETFPEFIPGWLNTSAAQGWLRLGLAFIDDVPAAAQIWLVQQDRASIYKLSYDEQFSQLSIGSILTAHMMRHVIDVDHVSEVDYLTGDEPYKQDWMSDRRERWGIVAFNLWTVGGLIAYGKHMAGRLAKAIVAFVAIFKQAS